MRIVADVNVSPRVVATLSARGFVCERVGDVLDARSSDEAVLAHTAKQDAVLVSRDQDFSAILAVSGANKPSLINLRVSDVDPDRLGRAIAAVLWTLREDLERGAIVTIDDGGVRMHALPLA